MKTIQNLTDYDLLLIFKHFTLKERALYERVCKRWKSLLTSLPCINYRLTIYVYGDGDHSCDDAGHAIRDHIHVSCSEHVDAVLRKYKAPSALVIASQSAPQLTEPLSILASGWSSLEHLEIEFSCGHFSDEQMKLVSRICNKTMKHLVFSKNSMAKEMYRIECTDREAFRTSSLLKVLNNCPQLESVVVVCGADIGLKWLTKLPPNMTSLVLPSRWNSEADLEVFLEGDGRRLRQFQLVYAHGSHLREICSKMADLTTLIIHSLQLDSSDDLKELKNLRKLEVLRLGLSNKDVNEALLEVFMHNRSMKSLHLTLGKISEKFLTEVPKLCPNMRCLKIYNYNHEESNRITDKSLEALAALQSLETLDIPGSSVTPSGVVMFLKKCPSINSMNLAGLEGDLSLVVNAMVKLATTNAKVKYSINLGYAFNARKVVKLPNLKIKRH